MNCTNCGHQNVDGATVCASCGAALNAAPPSPPPAASAYNAPPAAAAPQAPIPNHLVWAILATLCCCLPTGIVSIVFAAQVDGKAASGDYDGARKASDNAKLWAWISLGLGLVGGLAYFGLVMLGAIADAGSY